MSKCGNIIFATEPKGFPRGMRTNLKDRVNEELLAFIKG
jgi:hypothetical protein